MVYVYNGIVFSLKKREILIHVTVQMNLGNINAKSNKPDAKGQILFHLYEVAGIGKWVEKESRINVTRGWRSYCLMGTELHFGMIRQF